VVGLIKICDDSVTCALMSDSRTTKGNPKDWDQDKEAECKRIRKQKNDRSRIINKGWPQAVLLF
jgi:hypothetical protein